MGSPPCPAASPPCWLLLLTACPSVSRKITVSHVLSGCAVVWGGALSLVPDVLSCVGAESFVCIFLPRRAFPVLNGVESSAGQIGLAPVVLTARLEAPACPEGGRGRARCWGLSRPAGCPGPAALRERGLREQPCGPRERHTRSRQPVQGLCGQPSMGATSGQKSPGARACQQRHSFEMLSWGGRGKRKWEGPVNHAGWEARRQGAGPRLAVRCHRVLVPGHRRWALASRMGRT